MTRLRAFIAFPLVRMLIGFFWVGGSIGLGSAAGGLLPDTLTVLSPLFLAAGALIGYWAFVRIVERRPVPELTGAAWAGEAIAGAAIGAALFTCVIAILFLLGSYEVEGVNAGSAVLASLVGALMASITEEVLMRAVAFRILEQWLGSWVALALTAALFGLLHLPNPQATLTSSAAIALEAGVMLAAAYMLTRTIWLAVGIHAAWNFSQGGIFGVATSGVPSSGYFKGTLHGSEVLSGGAFGPEASIVSVLLCLALGAFFLRIAWHRRHFIAWPA